jgi:hypothetical protein
MTFVKTSYTFEFNSKKLKLPLRFDQSDLTNIFISIDNAKSYEYLNLSLAAKHKKYISTLSSKTAIKTGKCTTPKAEIEVGNERSSQSEVTNMLIGHIFEVLTALKKDKVNYRQLSTFLRYPHSSIFLAGSPAWQSYQQ